MMLTMSPLVTGRSLLRPLLVTVTFAWYSASSWPVIWEHIINRGGGEEEVRMRKDMGKMMARIRGGGSENKRPFELPEVALGFLLGGRRGHGLVGVLRALIDAVVQAVHVVHEVQAVGVVGSHRWIRSYPGGSWEIPRGGSGSGSGATASTYGSVGFGASGVSGRAFFPLHHSDWNSGRSSENSGGAGISVDEIRKEKTFKGGPGSNPLEAGARGPVGDLTGVRGKIDDWDRRERGGSGGLNGSGCRMTFLGLGVGTTMSSGMAAPPSSVMPRSAGEA
ncbi:hypothetical protein EYF80_052821 [Liparis tanakae]|uniref:Uncharacterized protein n=1 Tax=Liparis tanakae TaxID=230148 RepID=A0A4Z2F9L4_9TELE|nr:hypothetical protein EYF80_052821 [Liparis tanakae]